MIVSGDYYEVLGVPRDADTKTIRDAFRRLARWLAVAAAGLTAIGQMFFIPAYPLWSLLIIAVEVVALWGLCAYGRRENIEAAS